ncbi:MAG: SCO family protein [Pseudomonadota bacterium]
MHRSFSIRHQRGAASSIILAASCLIAALLGIYIGLYGFKLPGATKPPEISGFLWPQQKIIHPFEMVNQDGDVVGLESLQGEWNLIFFGYTQCPDICPITMLTLKQAHDEIGKMDPQRQTDTRVTFVSVDGARDTPENLARYIDYFNPDFNGLTGDKTQVDSLTTQLGIPYEIDPHEPGEAYLVSHSGAVLVVTPEGTVASIFQGPHDARPLAENYLQIRRFMEANS